MAGNVTAFNTVWTYDIYQCYIKPRRSDAHYLWIGPLTTVVGIALSVAAAYLATQFNNIMDMLQLVFAFVNAPLFATFLLGMFWKRATGHGAFVGLVAGHAGGRAAPRPDAAVGRRASGSRAAGSASVHQYPSEMAQNFWTAIFAWTTCFVVTIVVSLVTRRRPAGRGAGRPGLLAHAATRPNPEPSWCTPERLGVVVLALVVVPQRHLLVTDGSAKPPRHPPPHRRSVRDPSAALLVSGLVSDAAIHPRAARQQREPLVGHRDAGLRGPDARLGRRKPGR